MAITRSAKKAHRASLRRREFNIIRKTKVAKSIKSFKKFAAAKNKKGVDSMMREVQSALDKAVKAKTIKKNTAARRKARLAKLAKKISQ